MDNDELGDTHDTILRPGAMRAAMTLLQSYMLDRGEAIVKKVQALPALDQTGCAFALHCNFCENVDVLH